VRSFLICSLRGSFNVCLTKSDASYDSIGKTSRRPERCSGARSTSALARWPYTAPSGSRVRYQDPQEPARLGAAHSGGSGATHTPHPARRLSGSRRGRCGRSAAWCSAVKMARRQIASVGGQSVWTADFTHPGPGCMKVDSNATLASAPSPELPGG
jgi:hypothetical protein